MIQSNEDCSHVDNSKEEKLHKMNQTVSIDTLRMYFHPDDSMFIEKKFVRENLPLKVVRGFPGQLLFRDSKGKSVWGLFAFGAIGGMTRPEDWNFNPPSGRISVNIKRRLCRRTYGTTASISFSVSHVFHEFDNFKLVDKDETIGTLNYVKGVVRLLGVNLDMMNAIVSRSDLFCHIETLDSVKNYLPLLAAIPFKRRKFFETSVFFANQGVTIAIYDKCKQMESKAVSHCEPPSNTMRIEIRLKNAKAVQYHLGIHKGADLLERFESLEPTFMRKLYQTAFRLEVPEDAENWANPSYPGASDEVTEMHLLGKIHGSKSAKRRYERMVFARSKTPQQQEEYLHAYALEKPGNKTALSRARKEMREANLDAALCAKSTDSGRYGVVLYAEIKAKLFRGRSYPKATQARVQTYRSEFDLARTSNS